MKTPFLILMLALYGTAFAHKPFADRPQIDFYHAVAYELPADTCEYAVSMNFAHNLVRTRDLLTVQFYLIGPDGQISKPGTMLIQGDAASRRDARRLRRAGHPVPGGPSDKARRGEIFSVVFTMLVPDKQPWMDGATGVRIKQTLQRGNHTETVPEQTIPLNHTEGYSPKSRTHSTQTNP